MANGTYTFQTVTVPGASGGTWLGGINNAGEVTGYFSASNGASSQAFVEQGGSFTPFSIGLPHGAAAGINNLGQVAVTAGDVMTGVEGAIWSAGQTTIIGRGLSASGINDGGTAVGTMNLPNGLSTAGFISRNGVLTQFTAPGATNTQAHGINNQGEIVGTADGHGFADINGQFSTIDVPGAVKTDPAAVNLAGVIAGSYYDGAHWHGFVDTAGQMQFINAPGASDTWVGGINDSNQLSGYFQAAAGGPIEGFIATDPPAAPPPPDQQQVAFIKSFGHSDVGRSTFGMPLHMTHHHG